MINIELSMSSLLLGLDYLFPKKKADWKADCGRVISALNTKIKAMRPGIQASKLYGNILGFRIAGS